MLTPYLPYPPSSGGQIRSYNLIKNLSQKHRITLCSLIKGEDERRYIDELEKFCEKVFVFKRASRPWTLKNILMTAFSAFPFLVIRNYSAAEKKEIANLLSKEDFDIIHAETFYVSPHIPKTDIPMVLVDQTIEYQVYLHFVDNFKPFILRPLLLLDVLKIKFWEGYYWKRASQVIAVSERDANEMKKIDSLLKPEVIPNGVGEEFMVNVPMHFSKRILFMGNYAWLQNIEAVNILAKKVYPKIKKELPDVELVIAGQNTDKITHLISDGITIHDLKIDDTQGVIDWYHRSGVLVAPLYGPGGTRLKILAAMAAKLPVVTTEIGIEGIDAKNREAVLFSNSPDTLVELTVELLKDKKLYQKIASNGRKLVEQNYTYPRIADKLSKVYKETLKFRDYKETLKSKDYEKLGQKS